MAQVKDPVRSALVGELRKFRRGEGYPSVSRMTDLFYMVEGLGDGIPERAFDELRQLYEKHGQDPTTAIGAFFYLSGWGVGLGSVDQRRNEYVAHHFAADVSTPWRRSQRGADQLAAMIRDRDEHTRPWAFVSVFQSKNSIQPVLDFNLGYESWQKPGVFINNDEIEIDFHVHPTPDFPDRYSRRIILPETPLNLDVGFGERMVAIRVDWPMPVWPVWSVLSWTADPRILTHLRTFRSRSVEVSLQWWRQTPPNTVTGLVRDSAIWAERTDPNAINLPEGWSVL